MKFSIKDFLRKCDQIRIFLRIRSHLLTKSLMENFIFLGSETFWVRAPVFNTELCINETPLLHLLFDLLPCYVLFLSELIDLLFYLSKDSFYDVAKSLLEMTF